MIGVIFQCPFGLATWIAVDAVALTLPGLEEIYKLLRPVADDASPPLSSRRIRSR